MKRIALVAAAALVTAFAGAAVARSLEYQGLAKPGVHVLGADVGGKSPSRIERLVHAWAEQPVTIRVDSKSYRVPRGWIVAVDARATARRALAAGSLGALVIPDRVDVDPVLLGRAGSAGDILKRLGRADVSPVSATVTLHGTDVHVTPARAGRRLDRRRLVRLVELGRSDLEAPFATIAPAVTDAEADAAAQRARTLVAQPVAIAYHGARLGYLSSGRVARAVAIAAADGRPTVTVNGASLAQALRPRLGRWIVRARNARFVVTGDSVRIAPSTPGRDLAPAQVAAAVERAAAGDHVAQLELGPRQPDLTTAEADALGIKTKLVSYTTQMGASSSNRIHNVHLMADFIDGTLIKPGQVFSFNDVVGPRTAERGFLEGSEIIGSLVLPSIGGGVCQTATTLFNDALETGLPILERTNHNLYLAHYPLGRDATVSWGGPDFKFRNDLKHGILIKASYTDATLTFTFYGTPEGRRVVMEAGPQTNWTRPSMNYAVDPAAPPKSVKVVAGSGELGFDIVVKRTVFTADGKVRLRNVFKSHYIPDSPTTVYGPGKKPPGPYIVIPPT